MAEVSVVVVTWNARTALTTCLQSLAAQRWQRFDTIVVDNGSSDGTTGWIRQAYPRIRVIANRSNRGFAEATNQGIAAAPGRDILTLNSDCELDPACVGELVRALEEADPSVGMVAAKLLRADRRHLDSTGLVLSRARRFFDRGQGQRDFGQFDTAREIFGPCAACALYRRTMLEQISRGGEYFDRDFFFLVEDVDLAWRAQRCGWRALLAPAAVAYHRRQHTSFPAPVRQFFAFRNRYWLMVKNDRWSELALDLPWVLAYDAVRFPYLLLVNRQAPRAVAEVLGLVGKMRRKRAWIKARWCADRAMAQGDAPAAAGTGSGAATDVVADRAEGRRAAEHQV